MTSGFQNSAGVDLDEIFTSGNASIVTSMIASDGKDLGNRFVAGSINENTGFQIGDGSDLCKKFGKMQTSGDISGSGSTTITTTETTKTGGTTSDKVIYNYYRGINFPYCGGSSDIGQLSVDSTIPHIKCEFIGMSTSLDFLYIGQLTACTVYVSGDVGGGYGYGTLTIAIPRSADTTFFIGYKTLKLTIRQSTLSFTTTVNFVQATISSINRFTTYRWLIAFSEEDPSGFTKLYNVLEPKPDDENSVYLNCELTCSI